jgi:hypothetical protein
VSSFLTSLGANVRFWHLADIIRSARPFLRVKRTCLIYDFTSANDPKRTCAGTFIWVLSDALAGALNFRSSNVIRWRSYPNRQTDSRSQS